jgi:hypothetical protein
MRRTLLLLLLAACGSKASSSEGAAEPTPNDTVRSDAQMTQDLLTQVHDALGCPQSKAPLCIAADGWAKGEAAPLPASPSLLVGLSVSLAEADPVDKALEQTLRFSALGVRGGDKPLARIAGMEPSNPDEQKAIDQATAQVNAVFHGESAAAQLPKPLVDYLADLPSAGYALSKGAHGWTFKSGATSAELRKAGDYWIAVEVPQQGDRGIFVSVFTSKLK